MAVNLEKLAKEKIPVLDREIGAVFPRSGIPNLHDAVWYQVRTGGKRLRPLLAFMTCESLGGSEEQIAPFAAACDVTQHWILIHDDIEDGDRVRRDQPALWVKYGLPHGINVGDYMAQKVYELVLRSGEHVGPEKTTKLVGAMAEAVTKTAEGQALELNLRENDSPSEEDYMEMVVGKTAHYLTVPMVGGAIVADRGDLVEKLVEYGRKVGPAFQITDDVLDLIGGKGRGETGRDIYEGKRSILAIHCMDRCSDKDRKAVLGILNKPVNETTKEDVAFVRGLFEKHGSVEYARERALELTEESKKVIDDLPEELREMLTYFADYLNRRKK